MRSNNQSRSTRCVRATCRNVGARIFNVILITASLSSNKRSFAKPDDVGTLGGTKSTSNILRISVSTLLPVAGGLRVVLGTFDLSANTSITKSHNMRAGSPSIRVQASSAMISASELEWDTSPCFLHNHVMGHHVCGPTSTRKPPVVDLLPTRSPAKEASENRTKEMRWDGSPT